MVCLHPNQLTSALENMQARTKKRNNQYKAVLDAGFSREQMDQVYKLVQKMNPKKSFDVNLRYAVQFSKSMGLLPK